MDALPVNYIPGDPGHIANIVWEVKTQGIFDNFRKECIADVDTKPAYQNLRQRVEGSVSSFLNRQKWSPDLNKNQLREQLRKNIIEAGYLDTGLERIVDQVVNPKMNSVFMPKVTDVVYKYLGLTKPDAKTDKEKEEELKSKSEKLLPKELEAVSPESGTDDKNDDSNLSLESMKIDEDESPPFEPLDEENSVDSHLSGMSGLQSHDDSNSSPKALQIDDTQMSKLSSDGNSMEVDEKMVLDNSELLQCQDTNSKGFEGDSNSSSLKLEIKKEDVDQREENKEKKEEGKENQENKIDIKDLSKDKEKEKRRSDSKNKSRAEGKGDKGDRRHDHVKDKYRDKDNTEKSRDRDKSRNDKEKHKSSSHRHSGDRKKEDRKDRERDSSSKRDKEKGSKDRDTGTHRSSKSRDDKSRSRDSHRDRKIASSRSDKEKDRERREKHKDKKDDHYSSKNKSERRSNDRDSNDGSGLKGSSGSNCESSNCSQRSQKESSNSNDSGNSTKTDNKYKSHNSQLKHKVSKSGTKSEKEAKKTKHGGKSYTNIELDSEMCTTDEIEIRPKSLPSMSVSAATWDKLEAELITSINYDYSYDDTDLVDNENNESEQINIEPKRLHPEITEIVQETSKLKEESCKDEHEQSLQHKTFKYYTQSEIDEDQASLNKSNEYIVKLEKQIENAESHLELCKTTQQDLNKENKQLGSQKRKNGIPLHLSVKKNKNNNLVGKLPVINHSDFNLPLSPAESDSDKSTDKKPDQDNPAVREPRRKGVTSQRYSSEDLYKPRPVISRTTNRRRGNLEK